MKLQIIEEPQIAFYQSALHIDIRAGLSSFGAFDKGKNQSAPTPIRIGVIGTTATVDGVRDWLERCKDGVLSEEEKLENTRPSFPGMTQQVFGTSLELSDALTRTITRHELTARFKDRSVSNIVDAFMNHVRSREKKRSACTCRCTSAGGFRAWRRIGGSGERPPLDEVQEPVPEQEVLPPSSC